MNFVTTYHDVIVIVVALGVVVGEAARALEVTVDIAEEVRGGGFTLDNFQSFNQTLENGLRIWVENLDISINSKLTKNARPKMCDFPIVT